MEKVSKSPIKYSNSYTYSWEIIPNQADNGKGFSKAGYVLSVIDLIATQSVFSLLKGKGYYQYVTRSVDELNFYEKLKVGDIFVVESQVCGTWSSSLELQVDLFKFGKGQAKSLCCQCFLTFVLVGGPTDEYDRLRLPPTLPGSPQLEKLFAQRTARRQEIIRNEKECKEVNKIFRNYLMSDLESRNNPTYVQMSKIVLPIHTNGSFNTFGGQLLNWMETCAALCGGKFIENHLLTANMKHTQFFKASKLGDGLIFRAIITRIFNTSLEVYITVEAIYKDDQKTRLINDGFFTFVCADENGKPQKINKQIEPRNMAEKTLFDLALKRRANRLKNPQSPTLFELKGSKL